MMMKYRNKILPITHQNPAATGASVTMSAGRQNLFAAAKLMPVVIVLFGLGLALYYQLTYKYHFFWQEQNQLFLLDWEYISHYYDKPAWLACLVGDYLTQFYYYLYAGSVILSILVSITLWLMYRSIYDVVGTPPLSSGQVLAMLITIAAGIWLVGCTFSMFFRLASLLCITGGIVTYRLSRSLRFGSVLMVPLAYWLFGLGALVTVALLLINCLSVVWRDCEPPAQKLSTLIAAGIGIALAFLTPLLLAPSYSLPYGQALIYPGMARPVLPEHDFETNLGVENEYYFGNYDTALKIARDKSAPDAVSAFYYYLINARRDSLPDHLLDYGRRDIGTLHTIDDTTPRPVINMMHDLYFALGDMTYAERAAMMRNVFSDNNRNVRMIKRLAEINLQSGDTLAAKKYLRILGKTLAYRQWATMTLESLSALGDEASHSQSVVIPDNIRLGDNCRTILVELLESNPDNTIALDYLLCTDLLLKEMDTFKADYDRYCMNRGRPRLRRLYQEALCIYMAGTDAPYEQWQRYVLPESMERFKSYNQHRRSSAFWDTYWYYFDTTK